VIAAPARRKFSPDNSTRALTSAALKRCHAGARQRIGEFVHRMTVVAARPGPGDDMGRVDGVDALPEIDVLDWIFAGRPPAAGLPPLDPGRCVITQILRVGDDLNGA
jgi:hypothetical protein